MTMKKIWEKARKDREKIERANAKKEFAAKAIDKADEIKDAVTMKVEAARDAVIHAAQNVAEDAKNS